MLLKRVKFKLQQLQYKLSFKSFGKKSCILSPYSIDGAENIIVGDGVRVGEKSWIAAMPLTDYETCELIFEDGVTIGGFNHIYATGSIHFHRNALTANFVYITDNLHEYEDISKPIIDLPIKQLKPVVIGEGCWIGEHVAIIGASVGKHSVIGSNAVVTHDIPDYCVAVGAPAYIIKRYNDKTNRWEKTNEQGDFI